MSEEVYKAFLLPVFSGKEEEFELFWPRFQAYAALKGFREAIQYTKDPDLPDVDGSYTGTDAQKLIQKKADARNKLAMAVFTMEFKTVALMDRISSAKTPEYPDGLAYLVVKGLLDKYRPKDRVSKLEALTSLNEVEAESDDDPDEMFNKIATVKQTFIKSGVDEANYLNHAINIAPKKYKGIIA